MPQRDAMSRLLHRFYEPLVLLKVLDPTRGKQNSRLSSDLGSDGSYNLWCKFLDQLSWMCDYKQGGDTVSAIGVEETTDGPTFWLAANKNPKTKAQPHLEWILGQLESLPGREIEQVEEEILIRCIGFSRDKVKNYVRQLCTRIRICTELLVKLPHESGM
jgi:hypothetical protein